MASPSRHLTLIAPINIVALSTCVSSRLTAPENASADYAVGFSALSIATP